MATNINDIDMGATVWMIASTALVFLMIPGLGYFYGGMVRSKNALSLVFLCMMALAVVTVQWVIWGYSLALSETATNPFIGNLKHWLFLDVEYTPHPNAPKVPGVVYAVYQCMFAALTPGLAIGGAAERIRVMPTIVYIFIWSTLVYDPIAYWVWAPNGWLYKMGVMDFAGGCAVETASGFSALAFYFVLGKRKGFGEEKWQPHNYLNILLGCSFLYFGWFGFNAGAASLESGRAGIAFMTTNLAAASAGITWVALAYRVEHKFSSFHFCSGAVAGMVCVTPAASFVNTWAALPMGFLAGICCYYMIEANLRLGIDDCIDVLAVHGIGGLLGVFLTGVFANKHVIELDGIESAGGLINGNGRQLYVQLAALAASAAWSFVVSFVLLKAMNYIPMFRFRVDSDAEDHGVDFAELGEAGYSFMQDIIQMHTDKNSLHCCLTPSYDDSASIQHPHKEMPMIKEPVSLGNITVASDISPTTTKNNTHVKSIRSYPL
ncbi:ammonium transporter 1 [Coemansia reversa NRRL 1564]|uniref:Ammonium transporter n=1 Tax=Coemansia reversa (strain ATCC 12441 / NRRL 1564) TaxID=763665 RepID=A0A2G5BI87_COERN|nr:ammonium transporter 1 [Coemansia reversa NRRL 1564]|eukprot:PIA18738.1 ammonium transporter 1 [Coemansia reversa NRRL 1564]